MNVLTLDRFKFRSPLWFLKLKWRVHCVQQYFRYRTWPDALVKATIDPFTYALGLRDGRTLHFDEAMKRPGGWVHITCPNQDSHARSFDASLSGHGDSFPLLDRGIDIRLSEIVWVADAPHGS